jgi:hypothetical protein
MSQPSLPARKSRRLTLIGVVEIVLGSLILPVASFQCLGACVVGWLTAQGICGLGPYPPLTPAEQMQRGIEILAALLICLSAIALGFVDLMGGIGLLRRHPGGRRLSLLAAWLASILAAILLAALLIVAEGDRDLVLLVGLPILLAWWGWHAWAWRVLRTPGIMAEFAQEER